MPPLIQVDDGGRDYPREWWSKLLRLALAQHPSELPTWVLEPGVL
jgi:hypothetical protein